MIEGGLLRCHKIDNISDGDSLSHKFRPQSLLFLQSAPVLTTSKQLGHLEQLRLIESAMALLHWAPGSADCLSGQEESVQQLSNIAVVRIDTGDVRKPQEEVLRAHHRAQQEQEGEVHAVQAVRVSADRAPIKL